MFAEITHAESRRATGCHTTSVTAASAAHGAAGAATAHHAYDENFPERSKQKAAGVHQTPPPPAAVGLRERQILTLWISCCSTCDRRSMTSAYRWNVGVLLLFPANFLAAICAPTVKYSVTIYASLWRKSPLTFHLRVCIKWKKEFGCIINRRRNSKY